MDIIADKSKEPSMHNIEQYMNDDTRFRWRSLTGFIEGTFNAKPALFYSKEKPGWNVKYKKSSKALCTLYPEKERFIALIVLNAADMQLFECVKQNYTFYVNDLYEKCRLYNGTKWLMITVSDDDIRHDVQKLILLKLSAVSK